MTSRPPLSNGLALLVTLGAAGAFFVLFFLMPGPHPSRKPSPVSPGGDSLRKDPAVLLPTRCSQCHALPVLSHRSPEDWRILVLKMNRYMKQTGRHFLSEDEAIAVTRYIVRNQR
ncbi:MAG: hypothetical protein D084_Lepto4C00045G0002 [Leptospirillum sp. Group IV 'UBA BS']|nr:MAG: hypothetical protein D084_Lepto4C00045G0002 [Leptospirillum sp. Group IV 'UBA BS']